MEVATNIDISSPATQANTDLQAIEAEANATNTSPPEGTQQLSQQPGYVCLKGEMFELHVDLLKFMIGRGPGVDVDFGDCGDRTISKRHALIEYNFEKQCFELSVLSKNGVFINSQRYMPSDGPQPLRHRDAIDIGLSVRFCFLLPKLSSNGAASAPGASTATVSLPPFSPGLPPVVQPTAQASPNKGAASAASVLLASSGTKLKITLGGGTGNNSRRKSVDEGDIEEPAAKRIKTAET